MNVSDIFTRIQRTFGDESAVQVTEEDVIRWINDAQREVVMQHEGLLQKVGYLDSVVDQVEYDLPTDLFTLSHVYYKDSVAGSYFALRGMSLTEFSEYIGGWSGTLYGNGYPMVFTRETDGKITIFPRPDQALSEAIKLTYSRYATELTTSADTIDLPQYYHSYVEHFCMMKAYEMDEDWESADRKAALIQSTMDFNNARDGWFGRDSYPAVMPLAEDY